MLMGVFSQAREITSLLVGSLLSTAWVEVINFFPAFVGAIVAGDWTGVFVRLLILVSAGLMIYRLVRKMPFMTLQSIQDV